MDLSLHDIRTHARPYGFDFLLSGNASRLNPAYSRTFVRSTGIRGGGSHEIYAAWFKKQLAQWPQRIFPLGNNHPVFGGAPGAAPGLGGDAPGKGAPGGSAPENTGRPSPFKILPLQETGPALSRKGMEVLMGSLEDPRYSQDLLKELSPLILPDTKEVSVSELKAELSSLAPCYGRENNCG
jgi:hypothetical protein